MGKRRTQILAEVLKGLVEVLGHPDETLCASERTLWLALSDRNKSDERLVPSGNDDVLSTEGLLNKLRQTLFGLGNPDLLHSYVLDSKFLDVLRIASKMRSTLRRTSGHVPYVGDKI